MKTKELFKEKERLYKKGIALRDFTYKIDDEKQLQYIRKEQDDAYKKYKFYQGFMDALKKQIRNGEEYGK